MSTNMRTRWTLLLCVCINQNTNGLFLSCFPSTIKHRNFYFRVFSPTSSLGLKCLCLLQRGSFIGFLSCFPSTIGVATFILENKNYSTADARPLPHTAYDSTIIIETLQVNYFLDSKEWYFTVDFMITSVITSLSLTYSTHYYLFD